MKIHTFTFGPFAENTYLLYDEQHRAWVLDPGMMNHAEEKTFCEFLEKQKLSLHGVLLTHGHIDHVYGCAFLYEQWGLVPFLHKDDFYWVENLENTCRMYGIPPVRFPEEKKTIKEQHPLVLGDETWQVLGVPGHSPGSIAFYNSGLKVVISGDALFSGSIGRTDFPGGDYNTLIHSIQTRLFSLPEDTLVLSGHGPETTIGHEKKFNPFFQ